jgi:hypothetical protein
MKKYRHIRILPIPNGDTIPGGWLDDIRIETNSHRTDLVMEYRAFQYQQTPELFEEDGHPLERICGSYIPCRLCFHGVSNLVKAGLYRDMKAIPPKHAARSLRGMFHWRTREGKVECILLNASDAPADLQFSLRSCTAEVINNRSSDPVELVRDWSPAPQLQPCQVPEPRSLHQRFGGDPVTVALDGKKFTHRLFIGGLEIQPRTRPIVDAVLNLCEEPSFWSTGVLPLSDRWSKKGEGYEGMNLAEITAEASWVIERLLANQRVLVHCWAGMNRSATIVCAVLILLEGLSAEDALRRVRGKHPWARPDSYHWLMLRWLAKK